MDCCSPDVWDIIWMPASWLPRLSGTWFSVSAAHAHTEPVGTAFSAPFLSRSPLFQRWLMPDLREGCSLVSAQFCPTYRGRAFSQRATSEQCSFTLGQKEKNKQSPGPRTRSPFLTPWIDSRYRVLKDGLGYGDKKQEPRRLCVYKHIAKSVTDIIETRQ